VNQTLTRQIENYLDYLRDVRQLSPHTISNYRRDLEELRSHCEANALESGEAIQAHDIRQYTNALHRRGLGGSSIARKLSAVRSFFNHLGRQRDVRHNPAIGISAPKRAQRLPKALDTDAVNNYLQATGDEPIQLRDQAMAELFYSSGLRLAELASINLSDVDPESRLLTVTGKGSKSRTVPVGRVAMDAISAWLGQRPHVAGEQALFTSNRGRRISLRNIQARLRLRGRQNAMQQDVHPHMLRHSFASHMLESSGDLRAVQELLGHANISTTQVYTHLDFQHLAKVYDAAHPRARRKKSQPS
jgi:integrase/recombinase XerC